MNASTRLREDLREALDAFEALRLTIVEDRPADGDLAFVEQRENAIDDVCGWLGEAHVALGAGAPAALALAHRRLLDAAERVAADLASYERLQELEQAGRGRGRPWAPWFRSVRQALRACEAALLQSHGSVLRAWQELSDRPRVPEFIHGRAVVAAGAPPTTASKGDV